MARSKRRLKVPTSARRGESFVVKTLAEHPMETGRRRHSETGELVPLSLIERLECRYNGDLVFYSDWFTGVSPNPYLTFKVKAKESGPVEITWIENSGLRTTEKRDIVITDS